MEEIGKSFFICFNCCLAEYSPSREREREKARRKKSRHHPCMSTKRHLTGEASTALVKTIFPFHEEWISTWAIIRSEHLPKASNTYILRRSIKSCRSIEKGAKDMSTFVSHRYLFSHPFKEGRGPHTQYLCESIHSTFDNEGGAQHGRKLSWFW